MFQRWKWVSVCVCEDGVSPWEETQLEHPTPDTAAAGFVGWLTGELWLQTKCGPLLNSAWLSLTVSTSLQGCADATMCGEWFVQQLFFFFFLFFLRRNPLGVDGNTFEHRETFRLVLHILHFVLILKAFTGSREVTFPFQPDLCSPSTR